ncbi:PREDICTED: uncharacterized protein LOC109344307 [Lupinus angustifolius]|uniref:uncharacterized protein LOC109344307 n=1 Tax=Lupinus angustifolius TaxID=3871 RepID=UPI00092E554A|nr:PREDICTED: uncharacterized protein LOC109344307 [Lupinus angustifolius]
MNRNAYKEEKPCCYFHPKQVLVGVCPLCLNERLLIVAAKQGNHNNSHSKVSLRFQSSIHEKKPSTSIHKIFAFGSLFSSKQWKSENIEYDVSPTREESFISIKFEENGVASWEKSTVSNKVSIENSNWNNHDSKKTKSVIEHGKSRDIFRWRKRIGHMFHLIQWKKTIGLCHVTNKVEGVKGRKGNWMRTLTKKKTM